MLEKIVKKVGLHMQFSKKTAQSKQPPKKAKIRPIWSPCRQPELMTTTGIFLYRVVFFCKT
jgi:hypothetical protein